MIERRARPRRTFSFAMRVWWRIVPLLGVLVLECGLMGLALAALGPAWAESPRLAPLFLWIPTEGWGAYWTVCGFGLIAGLRWPDVARLSLYGLGFAWGVWATVYLVGYLLTPTVTPLTAILLAIIAAFHIAYGLLPLER